MLLVHLDSFWMDTLSKTGALTTHASTFIQTYGAVDNGVPIDNSAKQRDIELCNRQPIGCPIERSVERCIINWGH